MKTFASRAQPQPRALALSDRVYRLLLAAYPGEFRRRYGPEMAQVFRTRCRLAYQSAGHIGVARLWPGTLWDWIWTVGQEQLAAIFRRNSMNTTLSFDRQMGDLVWSLATGLHAAYSLEEVIGVLAITAPEPSASAIRQLDADLKAGQPLEASLDKWYQAIPSQHVAQVIAVIKKQRQHGGNLGDQLAELVDGILEQSGSDGAFYPAMRKEAEQLGAQVPKRAAG